ncbi:MAG: amidohydrolase family protein, partial [Armatimonadetes bacterium]|nr:amidohydrolase family protein [Armatimonadota bacterium]
MEFTVLDCNTHFGFLPYRDTDVSLDKLLAIMDANGVRAAMSYSLKGVAHDFEDGNEDTLAASRANPRIIPVATVDPRRHVGVIEEIERRKKQGFLALRLFPEQQGWRINSAMTKAIIRELERLRMPLMIACGGNGTVTDILAGIGDASIPVILHGVGYGNLADVLAACRENPNLHLDTQINDTPDSLEVGVDAIGPERFVFGSNSPSCSMRASLNRVAESA